MAINFKGRVAIVTGAGSGLGRCHALGLAALGAKVVVNDLGRDGRPSEASLGVVAEIRAAGGEAIADPADVSDFAAVSAMAERTLSAFGRIDVLVCNAGVLRDRSFRNMSLEDFDFVVGVHLRGAANCAKAVWPTMREQNYGRILLTTSASGLFGNFGQANYGAAKAGLIGLMNVLHLEGAKNDIRVNALAPTAATAMTEGMFSDEQVRLMGPETITPAVLYLTSEDAPSRMIMGAGGGVFAVTHILESEGVYLSERERTPDEIAARIEEISRLGSGRSHNDAFDQTRAFSTLAARENA